MKICLLFSNHNSFKHKTYFYLQEECYRNLKTGAESGWDFSSRWIKDPKKNFSLAFTKTAEIIPVDLNAFLCGAHKEVAKFHDLLGNTEEAAIWWDKALVIQKAIQAVLYDWNDGIWYDYDITSKTSRKMFFPSNFAPLWAEAYNRYFKNGYGTRAAQYFKKTVNEKEILGGIPSSLMQTGEQWDLPSAWPPNQDVVIMGLYSTGSTEAQEVAVKFARRWVQSNKLGYTRSGDMFEKYDALVPGQFGGGGEYTVQAGFGWSNGVVISFLEQFPDIASEGNWEENKNA